MECEIRVLAARFVGTGRLQVRRPERCTLVHHSMFREYRLPDVVVQFRMAYLRDGMQGTMSKRTMRCRTTERNSIQG